MRARSPHEPRRVATPLELLFDLVFVVAIAQAANGLHHAIARAHALEGLMGYLSVNGCVPPLPIVRREQLQRESA